MKTDFYLISLYSTWQPSLRVILALHVFIDPVCYWLVLGSIPGSPTLSRITAVQIEGSPYNASPSLSRRGTPLIRGIDEVDARSIHSARLDARSIHSARLDAQSMHSMNRLDVPSMNSTSRVDTQSMRSSSRLDSSASRLDTQSIRSSSRGLNSFDRLYFF